MPLSAIELPDTGWLVIGCVILAIAALFGLLVIIRVMRELRSGIAEELRRELAAAADTPQVKVQQPLEVKEHTTYATTVELGALKEDVGQLRDEVREGFSKLNDERRVSVANLHTKVDAANKKVDELGGQLQVISQQVGLVLNKLLNAK